MIHKNYVYFLVVLFSILDSFSQTPSIQWKNCYGGSAGESANDLICTTDYGFLIVGNSLSTDGDVSGNHGGSDAWLLKIDSIGSIVWQKCIGGSNWDIAVSIIQDSWGYTVLGSTTSNDFDINGNHNPNMTSDIWILRLDSNLNIIWSKCYGGSQNELAHDFQKTYDGGYIICGFTNSNDGDVSGFHYNQTEPDLWVLKIDSLGNIEWQKCIGGTQADDAFSVKLMPDSNFVLLGFTASNDGDIIGSLGGGDVWLLKISHLDGSIIWQQCFGGSIGEIGYSLALSNDGGFFLACIAHGNNGDVSGWHTSSMGWADIWIAKVDSLRNIQWESCFGGSNNEEFPSIDMISDNSCIVTCKTSSYDGDVVAVHDTFFEDIWMLRVDSGQINWAKTLGGTGSDFTDNYHLVKKIANEEYIACGTALSNNGDVSGNHGGGDYWVVKLALLPDKIVSTTDPAKDISCFIDKATGFLKVCFYSASSENLYLKVFDVTGRQLFFLPLSANVGLNRHTFFVGDIGAGIYLINLSNNSNVVTRKIMVE